MPSRLTIGTAACALALLCLTSPDHAKAQAYPAPYLIKGLSNPVVVNGNPNADAIVADVAGNLAGNVVVNVRWQHWEPIEDLFSVDDGCLKEPQWTWVVFEDRCYRVEPNVDDLIRRYSAYPNIRVTAVLGAVADYANVARRQLCSPPGKNDIHEWYCAPDLGTEPKFATFAKMLATRYDGAHGYGKIQNFVVFNEANTPAPYGFDVGAGNYNAASWVNLYAGFYKAAYDAIKSVRSDATVLISVTGEFDAVEPTTPPRLSAKTFIETFAPLAGSREWVVAMHLYPNPINQSATSADDYPNVTPGNPGVIVGWLRSQFPSPLDSHAWNVHFTEVGINSAAPSSQAEQDAALCKAFRNAVGTPGVASFAYFQHRDDETLVPLGFRFGLQDEYGNYKPAWATWATANRSDYPNLGLMKCGFETLPNAKLTRYYNPSRGHWVSTRDAPAGFSPEHTWLILREPDPQAEMRLLYECLVQVPNIEKGHTFVSTDQSCYGLRPMGPLGYVYKTQVSGTVKLERCYLGLGPLYTHWVSHTGCAPGVSEETLGYARLP